MSLEKQHHSNRGFKSLQKSYENWEAGEPSADLWENLEADLAVSAVWDRLDETLELNGSPADKSLAESYENWSPNTSGDGWSKLEEQLSRERVWQRLNTSLNYPVTTRIPWMKMAAASLIFVFTAFYTDYFLVSDSSMQVRQISLDSGNTQPEKESRRLASNGVNGNASVEGTPAVSDNQTVNNKQTAFERRAQHKLLVANANGQVNPVQKNNVTQTNDLGTQRDPAKANLTSTNGTPNNPDGQQAVQTGVQSDLADLDQLQPKEIAYYGPRGVIEDFTFLPYKAPFKPRFSVLVGGQFSFINEKNRSAFSSSIPSMGIAGDVQYHAYAGKLRFTQDLGFSQYAQSNGSYVNGRYVNSNQKLNTIYLMSSVGYTFKGITVSGGIAVNRLLNGYEESRTAITNVYNSKKLQFGATAGIDYHFTPFRNKTALGVGVQYQFVSRLKSENTVFNDIQGVKLQIKYSF